MTDFAGLTVRLLAETEKESDLKGAALLSAERVYDAPLADAFVAAGLKDGITFFKGSDGSRQCVAPYDYPYTKDSATWSVIQVAITPDKLHFLVWYQLSFEKRAEGYQLPSYLYRYSLDGTQEKKWELPFLAMAGEPLSWTQHLWAMGTSMGKQLYSAGDAWIGKQLGDQRSTLPMEQ